LGLMLKPPQTLL